MLNFEKNSVSIVLHKKKNKKLLLIKNKIMGIINKKGELIMVIKAKKDVQFKTY